jgi:Uma2 family endonuclease
MAVVKNFSDLDLTKTYTYADYLLWQFSERVELIKGYILKMSPAPSTNHQSVSYNLTDCFAQNFRKKSCRIFVAPFDVKLPVKSSKKDTTVVQPDLCVICDENKIDENCCVGVPDLIVEIISPNNRKHDVQTKFNLYLEVGVQEYWLVDPTDRMILIYFLKNGEYIGSKPFIEGDKIKSLLFPELNIDVEDVFYKVK